MTDFPHKDTIEAISRLAREGQDIHIKTFSTEGLGDGLPSQIALAIDPSTRRIYDLHDQIEAYRQAPARPIGIAQTYTLSSFIDLVNRQADPEKSVIFANANYPGMSLTAVLDYNSVDHTPGHLAHRITYTFPITDELCAWLDNDGKLLPQAVFAEWLEEHSPDLSSPADGEIDFYEPLFRERFATPARLIELSRDLEVHVGSRIKQSLRLASGERSLQFVTEHSDASGQPISIPGIFMISVPAWLDGDPVRIPARLRYRVSGGEIAWSYQLYRADVALRERVKLDLDEAADGTQLPTFEGIPEKAEEEFI